jgi:predicted O-methyltransferase YrrM
MSDFYYLNPTKVWFEDMLKLLPEPCVIIMDNALYHSTYTNNYPKCNARKADVQNWLKNQGVNFSPLETLAECVNDLNC